MFIRRYGIWIHNRSNIGRNNCGDRRRNMEFLAGLAIGMIVGAVGLVVVALVFEEK